VYVADQVSTENDAGGRPTTLRGVMVDVTARRHAEQRVRQYADVVERIQVAVMVARVEEGGGLRVVAANPETASVARQPLERIVGGRAEDVFPALVRGAVMERLAAVARGGEPFDIDNFSVRVGADQRTYSIHAFPLPGGAVGISLDDVTGPAMAAEALRRQALHDDLTGLPNRALLYERLQHALREARRTDTDVALLIMDLDQFKEVNDALGHHHGDLLLIELSRRLEHLLRECDTIARLGGDEFAMLLTTNADRRGAVTVAEKVVAALEQPIEVDGLSLQTNASIGIALYPAHADDADALAQRADVAMYQAKRTRSRYAVYASEQDRSSVRRLTLIGELRRAVELDELVLHYQPTVDLKTGALRRAEALVRWQHPVHGMLLPTEFIGLAEVSGTIQPLTRWVIERAVDQARRWYDAGHDTGVSVNLSVRNLYDRGLAAWLARVLADAGLPPDRLTLEITENEVMDDPVVAMDVLADVGALGVATSIDDFGTGYSSLSYLKQLPIDEIKIDRSFVAGMRVEQSDAVIVGAIITLGHDLGLTVVAEGIEDAPSAARLHALGCDRGQGFFFGPPMPAAELVHAPAAGATLLS
jgi:diguanylate cyclase (GGDEF)-like protein